MFFLIFYIRFYIYTMFLYIKCVLKSLVFSDIILLQMGGSGGLCPRKGVMRWIYWLSFVSFYKH